MTYLSGRGVIFSICLGLLLTMGSGSFIPNSQAATGNSDQSGLRVNPAAVGPGEVSLQWTAPGDDGQTGRAAGYDLRCAPVTSGPIDTDPEWNSAAQCTGEPVPSMSGQRDSILVTGLTPGAGYYFCLRAFDEAGNRSARSNSPLATAGPNAPQAPTMLTPANGATVQDYSPTLDWSDIAGADYYQIQIDNNSAFASPERSAQPTASTYTAAPDLTVGTWYWRVRVNVDSVFSAWSPGWSFILATPAPGTPTLLAPANGSTIADLSPLLDWSVVANADSYQVQVDNGSGFTSPERSVVVTTSQLTVTPDLTAGIWYWRVRACDNSVFGGWTAGWSFNLITDVTPPVLSGIVAVNITVNSAAITWTTDEAATSQVNYGTTIGYGQSTVLDTIRSTAHVQTLASLAPGTLYHYRVRSRDAAGNEAVSADFTFTTSSGTARDLALGIAASVSGTYPGYTVGPISDGLFLPRGGTASTWASDGSRTNAHWVVIDFGSIKNVQRVTVDWAWNPYLAAWMTSRQYIIQQWNGTSYVNITTVNIATRDSATTTAFTPVSTSRIRVYQPAGMGPTGYTVIMWLSELEIWGTDSGQIMTRIPGDVNGSGILDGIDLIYLIHYLKSGPTPAPSFSSADVDGSGTIDNGDVEYLRKYFTGSGRPPVGTLETAPPVQSDDRQRHDPGESH